jgi:hypothetical protein
MSFESKLLAFVASHDPEKKKLCENPPISESIRLVFFSLALNYRSRLSKSSCIIMSSHHGSRKLQEDICYTKTEDKFHGFRPDSPWPYIHLHVLSPLDSIAQPMNIYPQHHPDHRYGQKLSITSASEANLYPTFDNKYWS